jgi:hypothetical protein
MLGHRTDFEPDLVQIQLLPQSTLGVLAFGPCDPSLPLIIVSVDQVKGFLALERRS